MTPKTALNFWHRLGALLLLAGLVGANGGRAFATTEQLLTNGGFESPFNAVSGTNGGGTVSGSFPSAWTDNSRTQGKLINNTYSQETSNTISGTAFRADLAAGTGTGTPGEVLGIYENFNFVNGRTLTATVWMRASAPCTAQVRFLKSSGSFNTRAVTTCSVTTAWQQFTLPFTPTITEAGRFSLECVNQVVSIWMDEASCTVQQTNSTLYVSPTGSDATGSGSLAAPFQTIANAALNAYAGDTVQIRAGTYRETATIPSSGTATSPITFQAYPGETVTISGTDPITSWDVESTNVYRATNMPTSWATLGDGNQVFQNGTMMPEARWPNAGSSFPWQDSTLAHPSPYNQLGNWSYVDSASYSSVASFVDAQLPTHADGYWNGATIHIMSGNGWIMGLPTVTSYTDASKTIVTNDSTNLTAGGAYTISAGNEYYLTGIKGEMDSTGEWFYDTGTSRLDFYSSTGTPANVEVKSRNYGFVLNGCSYIRLVNLNFFGCTIQTNATSTYETFDGITMHYLGHSTKNSSVFGITLHNGDTLRNSELGWDSQGLIKIAGSDIRIINNNLHDSGYVPYWTAMADAGSNPGPYYLRNLISHNTMHDSGRAIMGFPGLASIFEFNDLYNGMKLTTDGAVFYYANAEAGNTTVRYNKIHDSTAAAGHTGAGIRGLYLDNQNSECIVHHNLIWNLLGTPVAYAFHLNARMSFDMVFNNTCYNCSGGSLYTSFAQDGPTGTKIYNNLLNGAPTGTLSIWNQSDLRYNLTTDPSFVDPANGDLRLQSSSPAIDAGTMIPGVTDGYLGAAPDLGALEYGGTDWRASVGYNATPPSPDPVYAMPAVPFANQVADGSFESGNLATHWTILSGSNVGLINSTSWYDSHLRTGAYSAQFGGGTSEISQVLTGLVPGARYNFYCGVQKTDASAVVKVGVRGYGNTTIETIVPTTDVWPTSNASAPVATMYALPFTTGPASTSATIYVDVVRSGTPVICPATSNTTVAPAVTSVAQANIPTAYPATGVYVDDLGVERGEALPLPAINLKTPMVQYLLDETSGASAQDASGNGRNATLSTGASNPLWQKGKFGNALGFDGVDDYALTPSLVMPAAITISCWAKSNSSTWNCNEAFVSQRPSFAFGPNGPGSQSIRLAIYSNGSTAVNLIWTPSASNGFAGFDVTQWHHYAGVFNPATGRMEIYVDGALAAWMTNASPMNASTGQINIGHDNTSGSGRYVAGVLDDVRVYDYALAAQDVAGLVGSSDSSLTVHLALDDGTGATQAFDASLNGRSGTLTNMNPSTAWVSGKVNGALSFNGVASYVVTPAVATPSALTVACWAKSNTATWNDSGCLIAQRPGFVLSPMVGSRNMSFIIYSDATTQNTLTWSAPPGFDITQWHHYGGVFNPGTSRMEFYVDGQLATALSTSVTLNPDTGPIFIGKDDGASHYFSGSMDDVQIYSRALVWNEMLELADESNAAPYYTPSPSDLTPPAIALVGTNAVSISAESAYLDSGASATDSVSGNVSVTVTGSVNTQQTGIYTITYSASDAAGNMSTATRTVTVTTTPHYTWRQSVFGAQAVDLAISGDLVDPNANGLVNLLEYTLGGNPLGNGGPTGVVPVEGRDGNGHVTLSFSRFASRSDITLTVQGADAPAGPWTDLAQSTGGNSFGPLVSGVSASESGSSDQRTVTVSDAYAVGDPAHPGRFLRLKVTH